MPNATRRAVCGKVVAGAPRVTLCKHLLKCQGVGPLFCPRPLGGPPNCPPRWRVLCFAGMVSAVVATMTDGTGRRA